MIEELYHIDKALRDTVGPKSVFNLHILPLCKESTFNKVILTNKIVGNIKTKVVY